MGAAEFLVIFLMLVFSGPVALVVCGAVGALLEEARNDGGTLCTPSRSANITASVPQARRRWVYERTLGPPAGWHEPAPASVEVDDIDDIDGDELEPDPVPVAVPVVVVPDPAPIAVEDWPTRQTVEPEVVTVNWTAARFGSLEIKRD